MNLAPELARLFGLADRSAQQRGDQFISTELVLLAACDEPGPTGKLLREHGVDRGKLEQLIDELRQGETVNEANAEDSREALERYTVDLTEQA